MSEQTFEEMLSSGSEGTNGASMKGDITTILVDGDAPCYRAAAVTDGHVYYVKGYENDGPWQYKADVLSYCKENELSLEDIYDTYEPEPLVHAQKATSMQMRAIEMIVMNHCEKYVFESWLSDPSGCFRSEVNPQYKANRVGRRRPLHLMKCKQYLMTNHNALVAKNLEADDMLTIRATELEKEGKPFVIASNDKDLKQKSGWHCDWIKDKYWYVSPEEAKELLWTQVVSGDTTDNILSPQGVGPAKAKVAFKGVDWLTVGNEELFERVTELYSTFLKKKLKANTDRGILPVTDVTDVRCWVEEVYHQVFLLREMPDGI